jgi:hypothetical protein
MYTTVRTVGGQETGRKKYNFEEPLMIVFDKLAVLERKWDLAKYQLFNIYFLFYLIFILCCKIAFSI